MILRLVKLNAKFYSYIPRILQLDREFIMESLNVQNALEVTRIAYPLLVKDRLLVMKLLKLDGNILGNLCWKHRCDRELVLIAVRQNRNALKYASEELRNDQEILKNL